MLTIPHYVRDFTKHFPSVTDTLPWHLTQNIQSLIVEKIKSLGNNYQITGDIAIHKTARIEEHAIIKGPAIISAGCFIAAHAYCRGGVLIGENCIVGPGTEIKSSIILDNTALAHFNFVGDCVIGSNVNMEAGSLIANHFNERTDKTIFVSIKGERIAIDSQKFGALVGDNCKIGANAVLSPGTILSPDSIVKRLALVEQCE